MKPFNCFKMNHTKPRNNKMLHLLNSPSIVNPRQVKHQLLMINKALKTLYYSISQGSIMRRKQ